MQRKDHRNTSYAAAAGTSGIKVKINTGKLKELEASLQIEGTEINVDTDKDIMEGRILYTKRTV